MNELTIHSPVPLPTTRCPITIRPGVMSDVPFLDSLQKIHSKQVGWMPTKQFEGKIALGHVLVAEEVASCQLLVASGENASSPATSNSQPATPTPVGYCIGNDQYFKRDDVGIIYQMNVVPGKQRRFVGAALLQAMFDRAAWGCKLFCCWCAQDIAANRFWEAMGFVPLAFRAGSEKKSRVHIFWQKRIRQGDTTTPYWFPAKTNSGSIREDRIVLPIPPGTHWSDAKPIILPNANVGQVLTCREPRKRQVKTCPTETRVSGETKKRLPGSTRTPKPEPRTPIRRNGLWFNVPQQGEPAKVEPPREKKPKRKVDPQLVNAARELRDRWLEQVNADPSLLLPCGKYDVSRVLAGPLPNPPPSTGEGIKALLPAA